MSAYQLASRGMSQQAAAELAIDEGDTTFHKSRPIPRIALDEDDETVLADAEPVRPRKRSVSFHAPHFLSASAIAPTSAPVSVTENETSWQGVKRGNSPVSHESVSYHTSPHSTRTSSVKGLHSGSPRSLTAAGNLSSSQRYLERMALPRDPQGMPIEPPQPNYGQVLSLTEEEEHDRRRAAERLQKAKSPRTPRTSLTPRLADRPRSISSTSHSSPMEKTAGAAAAAAAPSKPRSLSAAQQARLEKLAAPKKHPSPVEAEPERAPRPRSTTTNGDSTGSSSGIFDRLYASKKQTSPPPPEGRQSRVSSFSPPPLPRPYYGATHTPVTTQSTQPPEAVFQRLAQPKNKPPGHKDANGMVEYNPYGPVKRYYGGTTTISAPPTSTAAAAGGPSPESQAAGCGNSYIPKASWDMVDRTALSRSQPTLCASEVCVCVECGHAQQRPAVEAVAQPASGLSNKVSSAQLHSPRPVVAARPAVATTAANSSTAQIGAPTVVRPVPAKPSGTEPPVAVRTRRYVPPTEEEAAAAAEDVGKTEEVMSQKAAKPVVAAPQPVEATRRRTAPVPMCRESLLPENPTPVVSAGAVVASVKSTSSVHPPPPVAASVEVSVKCLTPVAAPSPTQLSVATAMRAVKPVPATVAEPTTRETVQAIRRRPSSSIPGVPVEASHDTAADVRRALSPPSQTVPVAAAPHAALVSVPASVQAATATQCAASNVGQAPETTPTHRVVQAVERGSRQLLSPLAPAAAPQATTDTLNSAMPMAPVSSCLPPSSSCNARSPVEVEGEVDGDGKEKRDSAVAERRTEAETEGSSKEEEGIRGEGGPLRPAALPVPKSITSPEVRAGESVYDRLAPPQISAAKLKTHRQSHKKRCIRSPKPEILKDEDFACQLEEFSPESRQPIVIRQKPKTTQKKTAAEKKR